jgi:hypothetical protein
MRKNVGNGFVTFRVTYRHDFDILDVIYQIVFSSQIEFEWIGYHRKGKPVVRRGRKVMGPAIIFLYVIYKKSFLS